MNPLLWAVLALQDPASPSQEKEVIIITPQRRESDILDVPSGVTVVTARQIAESGASNVVEVLQRQPGFASYGFNKGAYDQTMDLRGFNNGGGNGQRTLVLVDGRKTNNVASNNTDWATIPLESVERIEIVRGPAAALYGDGAVAGVVNVITKKGGPKAKSAFGGSAGNWGTVHGGLNFAGGGESLSYDLFAGVDSTDGWRENGEYRAHDLTARFEAPLSESSRWHVKLGRHHDRRERPGLLTQAQIDTLGRDASVTVGDFGVVEESTLDNGLAWTVADAGDFGLFLNHSQYDGSSNFGGFLTNDGSEITMLQFKHVAGPKVTSEDLTVISGIDLSYETADASSGFLALGCTTSHYRRRLAGLYTHLEGRPVESLVLSGSLRYDRALLTLDRDVQPCGYGESVDEQKAFDQLSPMAGVTFKALEELAVYASYGRTFRYPNRDELIGFFATDPQLEPERARTWEAGVRAGYRSWSSASLTAFRMVVENEIVFDPALFLNMNFDEVTHTGLEGEVRVTPKGGDLFATFTYTRAVITDNASYEGSRSPVTPRLQGTLGATARYEGASLTLTGRYVGERYLLNDFANTSPRLPSYWVYDAKLAWALEPFTLFAQVFNMTDREYFDYGAVGPSYAPAPERSWLVGGEVRF
jgi:iron complex outermembrane receptor protein